MTEKANPSPKRPADAFSTAGAIAYGGSVDGFIVDGNNPTDISTEDADIDETALNTFKETTSTTSLTVNIDPGEGFVFGSWIAIDTQTSVTLDASTSDQTVYLGWNKDTSNDVIIGKDSSFSTVQSDTDQRIPLYDFDTDSNGVTSTTDRRQVGRAQDLAALSVADELGAPVYSDSTNAPQTEGRVIAIDGSGSQSVGLYSHDGSSYIKASKSNEQIENIVAALVVGGTDININYDDANDTLTINNTAGYSDEEAQDAVATALSGGDKVGITYDDPNDTITIDTSALDTEEVEDQVNSLLTAGDNVNLTYDDANDTLTISVPQAGAFADSDADNIGELVSSLTGIQFDDGEVAEFGTDSDFDIRYNSSTDDLRFRDKSSTTDRMALDKSGNLDIEGTLSEGQTL